MPIIEVQMESETQEIKKQQEKHDNRREIELLKMELSQLKREVKILTEKIKEG